MQILRSCAEGVPAPSVPVTTPPKVRERSAGIIILRAGGKEALIVQETGGSWGPTKGHVESGETDEAAAFREVFEEVGIPKNALKLIDGFRSEVEYSPLRKPSVLKTVVLFAAHVDDEAWSGRVILEKALRGFRWVTLGEEAETAVTQNAVRSILRKLRSVLKIE